MRPTFISEHSAFSLTLKNLNFGMDTAQDTTHDAILDTTHDTTHDDGEKAVRVMNDSEKPKPVSFTSVFYFGTWDIFSDVKEFEFRSRGCSI